MSTGNESSLARIASFAKCEILPQSKEISSSLFAFQLTDKPEISYPRKTH
jgi:hypothetical protein